MSKPEGPKLRRDRVVWSTVDDEIVALDLVTSRYMKLNATATLLWERLDGTKTEAQLVESLRGAYALDEATAERHVGEFLATLAERDLLE